MDQDTPITEQAVSSTAAPTQTPIKLNCPKHGDITTSALYMTFKNGEKPEQFLYCLPCLNELLLTFQKNGALQQVQIIVEKPLEAAPISPEQEKMARMLEREVVINENR
jgi:hypothetical protein